MMMMNFNDDCYFAADMSRVVALIDMDCFYVQVEQREKKETRGTPCAVVQGTG